MNVFLETYGTKYEIDQKIELFQSELFFDRQGAVVEIMLNGWREEWSEERKRDTLARFTLIYALEKFEIENYKVLYGFFDDKYWRPNTLRIQEGYEILHAWLRIREYLKTDIPLDMEAKKELA